MNGKIIAAVIAAIVVIAAVGIGVSMMGGENKIGVVYNGNGGTTSSGESEYLLTSNTVTDNRFTRDGYLYSGWNTAADGSGTSYSTGDSIEYPSNGHVTLYAQWTENSGYSITSFSTVSGTFDLAGMSFTFNGHAQSSYGTYKVSGTTVFIAYINGMSNIVWDEANSRFTFTYNGSEYAAWFTFSGGYSDMIGYISPAGYACVGITVTGDISVVAHTAKL